MKKLLVSLAAMLLCVMAMGTALAGYGYTDVSMIPMAVDFTFDVTFDEEGLPQITTDYPFKSAGADEMVLVYNLDNIYEVVSLHYLFARGETSTHIYGSSEHNWEGGYEEAYQALRDGKLTLDDTIYIHTSKETPSAADWFLEYSISGKKYISYEEKTNSQGHNGFGNGLRKVISYNTNGALINSYFQRRINKGDLCINYDSAGNITSAYAYLNRNAYDYNESTGLFGGKKLSELGFDDSDILTPAPAALGDATDPSRIDAYITRCYKNLLGREPGKDELAAWREDLSSGRKTAAEIVDQFAGSAEFKARKLPFSAMVENLFLTMLDRPSDPAVKADWVLRMQQGQRLKAVMNSICKSGEYISLCETIGVEPGIVYVPVIIKK